MLRALRSTVLLVALSSLTPALAAVSCEGQGQTTVVFDYGVGSRSWYSVGSNWDPLREQVAKVTRTCTVKIAARIGLPPASSAAIARELWADLDKAGVKGPVVWAADHLAAITALEAFRQRPEQVRGLLLFHLLPPAELEQLHAALPPAAREGKSIEDLLELRMAGYDVKRSLQDARTLPDLGSRPLVLVSSSEAYHFPPSMGGPNLPQDVQAQLAAVHQAEQRKLLNLSRKPTQIVTKGHGDVALDADRMLAALRELLKQAAKP